MINVTLIQRYNFIRGRASTCKSTPWKLLRNPEGPRFQNPAEFNQAVAPEPQPAQQPGVVFNRPDFQAMREQALQDAIAQVTQRQATGEPQQQFIQPQYHNQLLPQFLFHKLLLNQ